MDQQTQTLLKSLLKAHGYSVTAPRRFVCELLWNREPQSMRELQQRLGGAIDRASLYRTIDLFEQLGIVQRIYIGWKYKIELSDSFSHHHHHISCLECGKIVAITEEDAIEDLITKLAAKHGFAAQSHQLEIRGVCAHCRAQRSAI